MAYTVATAMPLFYYFDAHFFTGCVSCKALSAWTSNCSIWADMSSWEFGRSGALFVTSWVSCCGSSVLVETSMVQSHAKEARYIHFSNVVLGVVLVYIFHSHDGFRASGRKWSILSWLLSMVSTCWIRFWFPTFQDEEAALLFNFKYFKLVNLLILLLTALTLL